MSPTYVLAGRVDHQLLLAVDDADVALAVDGGDVAGVQPAVGVDGLGRLLRVVAVALHHQRPAHEQFAVVGDAQLGRRDGLADGADADAVGRVHRGGAGGLGHAPDLAARQPEGEDELEGLGVDGRGAGGRELHPVQSQLGRAPG